jgi:hypothetical protein
MHQAQADRESRCSQHTWVCEHLSEAVLHPNFKKSEAGQRSHWASDGVLKPLLYNLLLLVFFEPPSILRQGRHGAIGKIN